MGAGRRSRRQHFLGHDIAFEVRALMAAVPLWPGHADPALRSDLPAKFARERALAAVGREGSGLDLFAQKLADLTAQFLGLGRQLDRIETKTEVHRCLTILG